MKKEHWRTRTVVIYIRVSTEEQGTYGFSLSDQEARLRAECERCGYTILKVYREEFSAKNFERPVYKQFKADIKSKQISPDIFLCVRPDRFSRNTMESFVEEGWLNKNNIELMFLEGQVDMEDNAAIILKAIGYAMPEADNLARSKNVRRGMRQGRKEGKLMGKAPLGYSNINSNIEPNADAELVIKAFNEVGKGLQAPETIRKQLPKRKGLSRNNFYKMLRNPTYAGIIVVDADKHEPEHEVIGIHKPLISRNLFFKVQEILKNRGKKVAKHSKIDPNLYLRGHLKCKQCGRSLTGSGTTNGVGKPYYYYHCQTTCGERYRASLAHQELLHVLETISIPPEIIKLYKAIMKDLLKSDDLERKSRIKEMDVKIVKLNDRLNNIQDQLADGELQILDYNLMRKRYSDEINIVIAQRTQLDMVKSAYQKYLQYSVCLLAELPKYFRQADPELKKMLVCSIFSEKLIFDEVSYRTPTLSPAIAPFILINKELQAQKKGLSNTQSPWVARRGIEPLFPE